MKKLKSQLNEPEIIKNLFEEFAINGIFNTIKEYYPEYLTSIQTAFRQVDDLKDLSNGIGLSQGAGTALLKGIIPGTDRVNALITICVNQDRLFGLAAKNSPFVFSTTVKEESEPVHKQREKTNGLSPKDLAVIAQLNEKKVEARLDPLNKTVTSLGETLNQVLAQVSVLNANPNETRQLQHIQQLQAQLAQPAVPAQQQQQQQQQPNFQGNNGNNAQGNYGNNYGNNGGGRGRSFNGNRSRSQGRSNQGGNRNPNFQNKQKEGF